MSIETAITFKCRSDELVGIIHQPTEKSVCATGVLIVVGGPQYRVGSHRQFVSLARDLAAGGIPVMRFDYRGMGDSEGEQISFEETGPDIKAAIDAYMLYCPGLERIVLWGLCDAASACLMYCVSDDRVQGLVLANPWVRTEAGAAKAHLKHYYTARFFQKDFWLKVLKFQFDYRESYRSLVGQIRNVLPFFKEQHTRDSRQKISFQKKMELALTSFTGRVLFITSGNDLTAAEFTDHVNASAQWKKKVKDENVDWQHLDSADHTFSSRQWKSPVSEMTMNWVKQL